MWHQSFSCDLDLLIQQANLGTVFRLLSVASFFRYWVKTVKKTGDTSIRQILNYEFSSQLPISILWRVRSIYLWATVGKCLF